jgi:hypothetical protein
LYSNNVFNKIASKLSSAQFTSEFENNELLENKTTLTQPNQKKSFQGICNFLSSGWTVV